MLKRLIEVALPLKEVSEQSAREKSIRHGHISTLHVWWARRPLAACRAVVFASLIPDPDDLECPDEFRNLVGEVLGQGEFTPKDGDGDTIEDTARNRCLEFIQHLVRWENSNNPDYIQPARKLIAAAHKILHSNAKGDAPKVLDPFSGGGAVPLEALRLGCESYAVDLNPVAHLIELCTLVYPQKYGQPNSRPVPDYIKRLIAHNNAKKRGKVGKGLFDDEEPAACTSEDGTVPDVEITEAEYRKNPLAADVQYWGHWLLTQVRQEVAHFYPNDRDGSIPAAYLWARNVKCPNPACGCTIPCIRQLWLSSNPRRKVALRLVCDRAAKSCSFEIVHGKDIDFDPLVGTMKRGQLSCPFCLTTANSKYLQSEGKTGRMGQQMIAVVTTKAGEAGKQYRSAVKKDSEIAEQATHALQKLRETTGADFLPNEPLHAWSGVFNAPLFVMNTWGDLFNDRQALALATFVKHVRIAKELIAAFHDASYATALITLVAISVDRLVDSSSVQCWYITGGEKPAGTFGRQALPMVWDYCEINTMQGSPRSWGNQIEWVRKTIIEHAQSSTDPCVVTRSSATRLPLENGALDAIITDPPYYDAVPYSDLSDFFYVWLRRMVGDVYPDVFRTPLSPKQQELVSHLGKNYPGKAKTAADYESGMGEAFTETYRVLGDSGVCAIMFAHKTTTAWESIISSLNRSKLVVTSSWPLHTERSIRLRSQKSAALASSVTLVCRKRKENAGSGLWDDIRQELKTVANERLDFFWDQGIRGADFFISAIGPALSVFGQYERVTKLSGDEVTVGQFLDEVRALVTGYALEKILHTTHTANIDPESRFYVVWKWSYGEGKVPADESFKLAQALGIDTELMWDKTGVLLKSGENVQAMPVAKRMAMKSLGDPSPDGTPGSLIDVLHRMCVFREKGDTEGMAEFVARSGQARNQNLWLVAQAVSEILPDGDKEKQLMQGLLNQKENLAEATRQMKLF